MEGKVALITGAVGGLGKAFAEALLEKGAKVCMSDINRVSGAQMETDLQKKYRKDKVFFYKCDVTSEQEFEGAFKETIKRYGHLDILCNNAGIGNETRWKLMLDINLTSVIKGTLMSFKYMGKAAGQSDGVVINIGSAAGVLPMPFGPVYTATKHGVVGLTRSIGVLSPKLYNVRVNCLCPSFANTNIINITDESFFGVKAEKFAEKMFQDVGIMQPREVAESFIKLVETDTSGATMLVTPGAKDILNLPKTLPEMFEASSKM